MLLRVILILLVVLFTVVLVLPFILNMFGFQVLQFGAAGGSSARKAESDPVLLRSLSEGNDWEDSSVTEDPKAAFPSVLSYLAFHPTNPNNMFLGTRGAGLWKTENGGAFWKKVEDKNKLLDGKADIQKISFAESDPKITYAAVFQNRRGRLLKSVDGGESFTESYFVTADGYTVNDFYVHRTNPDLIIIATEQGGVLETKNGGNTWRVVKWFAGGIKTLLVNPFNFKEIIVMGSRDEVYKTLDGGLNWADLTSAIRQLPMTRPEISGGVINPFSGLGFSSNTTQTLVADPNKFSTLFMGSNHGLFRSEDGGFTWARLDVLIPPEALPVTSIAVSPRSSNMLYVGAGSQLHKSDDGGVNWSVKILPTTRKIQNLLLHPHQPQVLFTILGR